MVEEAMTDHMPNITNAMNQLSGRGPDAPRRRWKEMRDSLLYYMLGLERAANNISNEKLKIWK